MNEYITFGKVIKTVNGIGYDVSGNYEIVEKGKVAELQKENEELKAELDKALGMVDEILGYQAEVSCECGFYDIQPLSEFVNQELWFRAEKLFQKEQSK